jgi:hypothetical protein
LFAILLAAVAPAAPDLPADPAATGARLCEALNLDHPGLAAVKRCAAAGDHAGALAAWRDWKVHELRRTDPGPFNWHGDQRNGRRLAFADLAVGKIDRAAYERKNPPATSFFIDRYGMSAPAAGAPPVDWMAQDEKGGRPCEYAHFYFGIPFCARFWETGEDVYLRKWFQLAADFARNQKRLVEALPEATRKNIRCGWTTGAESALAQGTRVHAIVRTLGVFCKSVDSGKPADWDSVNLPVTGAVSRAALDRIPAVELAQVALSLANDHPAALLARYAHAGAVPNQRREGIAAVLVIASTFPEFTASKKLLAEGKDALADYLGGAFHLDGGMLEQSFNYNLGDARSLGELADMLAADAPDLAADIRHRQTAFHRAMAAIVTPLGRLPALSSQPPADPPPLWSDAVARARWFGTALPGTDDPLVRAVQSSLAADSNGLGFDSVTLPYSGYSVQRAGWRWDAPYFFLQTCRRGRGHATMGHNALQLVAYGRPLIVTAGPPVYTPEQLPVPDRPDFAAINELLGEASSWKANTLLVDDASQDTRVPPAQSAHRDPIGDRWYVSPSIDYMEGFYADGYARTEGSRTATIASNEVTHLRQVVFLRRAGLWIIADRILNTNAAAHTYTQNWNLPGARADAKAPSCGFTRAMVSIDAAGQAFHTLDPDGPNLSVAHAGGDGPLTYEIFFGQKHPWRGWFSPGFGTLFPAPQVNVRWRAAGDTVLLTVLRPRPKGEGPCAPLARAAGREAASAAFSLPLADGAVVRCEAATHARAMSLGGIDVRAQLAVVVTGAGGAEGIVIGERGDDAASYAFQRSGTRDERWPVRPPQAFRWVTGANGQISVAYEP